MWIYSVKKMSSSIQSEAVCTENKVFLILIEAIMKKTKYKKSEKPRFLYYHSLFKLQGLYMFLNQIEILIFNY